MSLARMPNKKFALLARLYWGPDAIRGSPRVNLDDRRAIGGEAERARAMEARLLEAARLAEKHLQSCSLSGQGTRGPSLPRRLLELGVESERAGTLAAVRAAIAAAENEAKP